MPASPRRDPWALDRFQSLSPCPTNPRAQPALNLYPRSITYHELRIGCVCRDIAGCATCIVRHIIECTHIVRDGARCARGCTTRHTESYGLALRLRFLFQSIFTPKRQSRRAKRRWGAFFVGGTDAKYKVELRPVGDDDDDDLATRHGELDAGKKSSGGVRASNTK